MPSTFPLQADVEAYISALGVVDEDLLGDTLTQLRLDVKAEAAKEEWERRTGWKPFLKDTVDVTRRFNPPNGSDLWLSAGLLTLTSVTVGVTADDEGEEKTLDTDYFLSPSSASAESRPFEWISFSGYQSGAARSIVVVGRWGYSDSLPYDAWEAVRQYAAFLCYPELSLRISGGLFSVKTVETESRYSGGKSTPLSIEAEAWKANFDAAVKRYQRRMYW